jgi:hypothetical protein
MISRVASLTSSSRSRRRRQASLDHVRKRSARAHRRRYSLRHGVPPCWRRQPPAQVANPQRGCPPNFSSKVRTSPSGQGPSQKRPFLIQVELQLLARQPAVPVIHRLGQHWRTVRTPSAAGSTPACLPNPDGPCPTRVPDPAAGRRQDPANTQNGCSRLHRPMAG